MTAPSYVDLAARLGKLEDAFDQMVWQTLCELRVACPGIITKFNTTLQTVEVQLAITEKILKNLVPTDTPLPIIVDVPVMFPRAGGYTLTMPAAVGDECLVIFGDMCIDAWWQAGGVQNQLDKRRHDLSDGFALLGPWNKGRAVSGYSTTKAQLRADDGNTYVEIDQAGVVTVKATTVNVTATTANVTGSTQVNVTSATLVNINGSGHTTIEGRDFLAHKHTGVQGGGSNSGPVL